jgi:hypothetical protein
MKMRKLVKAAGLTALATLCSTAVAGPDVIVGDLPDVTNYGVVGGLAVYAVGTTSCNLGDTILPWISNTADHPVISQNMYQLVNGRFEQIGQAWLKHGFCALQGTVCSTSCTPNPSGCPGLGVLCSDPYSSGLNGSQSGLGPKSEVNAATGVFPYPWMNNGTGSGTAFKRLQASTAEIDRGGLFFVSSMYIERQDATANNDNNNQSYRQVNIAPGTYVMSLTGTTQRTKPAIQAWQDQDPQVVLTNLDIPSDGRVIVGSKVTNLGGGQYQFEYAVQNLNSDCSIGSFSIPLPAGAVVTNVGFHDVAYHSGEPYSGTDWTPTVTSSAVTWTTETFAQNPNANALRWDTIYNFRFECNMGPGAGAATLGKFKCSGSETAATQVPTVGGGIGPINDACALATTISPGSGTVNFNTSGATQDGPVECLQSGSDQIGADIWYKWTNGPCAGNATITTCGSSFDTKFAVYNGWTCPTTTSSIACNDDSTVCGTGSLQSAATFAVVANGQYLIRVGGYNGATGAGVLNITAPGGCGPQPPANDLCANAIVLANGVATNGTTVNATVTDPLPTTPCGASATTGDVWYTFTNGATVGTVTVTTCGSSYDTVVSVYTGNCGALTQVACNDDACGLQSTVTIANAPANQLYRIRVSGYNGATGAFGITATGTAGGPTPPANDPCSAPVVLNDGVPYSGSSENATANDTIPTPCATSGRDVWFTYTPASSATVNIQTCNSAFDTVLSVYTGNCGSLTQVACNDDEGTGGPCTGTLQSSVDVAMTAGTTYRIRLAGFGGTPASGNYTILVTGGGAPPAPSNDNCNNRIGVALGATPFTTVGATTDGPTHAGCITPLNDVWFNHPQQVSNRLRIYTCDAATNFDTVLAVYRGNGCANFATRLMACNDDSCGLQSSVWIIATAGDNYVIRIGGFNGATGSGMLHIDEYCIADVDDGSGTGTIDGGVTIDDLLYYLGLFEAGDSIADVDDGSGTGSPDGGVTIDDLLYYLVRFEAGC